MDIQRAIGILKEHNQWRRGNSDKMIDPTIIGEAIDCVVNDYGLNRFTEQQMKDAYIEGRKDQAVYGRVDMFNIEDYK
jgi:hypothetical protein